MTEISLDKDQILFTSIPYDESWHVFENGKEIKKEKTLGSFIGLNIGEGHHSLEFKFIPEGFYTGLIITFISWIAFFAYLFLMIRRHSKDAVSEENE